MTQRPLHYLIKHSDYYKAYTVDALFPHYLRHQTTAIISYIIILGLIVYLIGLVGGELLGLLPNLPLVNLWLEKVLGIIFILVAIWLVLFSFELFFRSYLYKRREKEAPEPFSYEVGLAFYLSSSTDLVLTFFSSPAGRQVMIRLGVREEDWRKYVRERFEKNITNDLPQVDGVLTLSKWSSYLYTQNKDLADWLFKVGVKEEDFIGASRWVANSLNWNRNKERWWSQSRLSQIPSLGRDFAYGHIFKLEKYGQEISGDGGSDYGLQSFREDEVKAMENVLLRSRETNVILSGETTEAGLTAVKKMANKISAELVSIPLQRRRLIRLDVALLLANFKERSDLEKELSLLLEEAVKSGNIILVIDSLGDLIHGLENMGSNPLSLLNPYLKSGQIQIIGLVDNTSYYKVISPNVNLLSNFEKIEVAEPTSNELVIFLQALTLNIEEKYKIIFTYPALVTLIESAKRYFSTANILDKVLDNLAEMAVWAVKNGLVEINKEEVMKFVGEKTSIPVGSINEAEKEKLKNLENLLHERVIGQNEAIEAVASTLRRARTSTTNPDRPMGSFLFLGPTGVGKTETAKALASVFFSKKDAMVRFDMSEFQGEGSLERLIGDFSSNEPGVLATALRKTPYAVLLLDEFEKASADIRNLFLQILDEGFFTDANGRRVNARNTIIIATSNAGADLIWQKLGEEGNKVTSLLKEELINHIIEKGIYPPELINRFDDAIIFHPLVGEYVEKVAKLLLDKFAKRLVKKGIKLKVTPELVKYVATNGADDKFGARPMNRLIQDEIESIIAEAIINDSVSPGSVIEVKIGETGELSVVSI